MKSIQKAIVAGNLLALSAALLAQTVMTQGEVRNVDKATRKITLKHDEIKNLDMPAMTMVFVVKEAAMLEKVKPGDRVQFHAENEDGKLTVTDIQPSK